MCTVATGSSGGQRLSLAPYVTGTGVHGRGDRRRRVLKLPTLRQKSGWDPAIVAATVRPFFSSRCMGQTKVRGEAVRTGPLTDSRTMM
jgi:hypothetical protein